MKLTPQIIHILTEVAIIACISIWFNRRLTLLKEENSTLKKLIDKHENTLAMLTQVVQSHDRVLRGINIPQQLQPPQPPQPPQQLQPPQPPQQLQPPQPPQQLQPPQKVIEEFNSQLDNILASEIENIVKEREGSSLIFEQVEKKT